MTNKKYIRIIMGGFVFSFIILIVLTQLTKTCIQWQNQVLLWIFWFSIILAILVAIFNTVASFNSFKRKFPAWSSASPALNIALIIYFGILLISLSYYKELVKQMTWDPTMLALGVAVLAFGWTFVIQHFQEQTTIKNQQKLESSLSRLGRKLATINSKIDKLSR